MFLVVDPESDMVVCLGGSCGCTTDERNSQGRGDCRTKERASQSVSCCGTMSCWGTGSHIRILAGGISSSVD